MRLTRDRHFNAAIFKIRRWVLIAVGWLGANARQTPKNRSKGMARSVSIVRDAMDALTMTTWKIAFEGLPDILD